MTVLTGWLVNEPYLANSNYYPLGEDILFISRQVY